MDIHTDTQTHIGGKCSELPAGATPQTHIHAAKEGKLTHPTGALLTGRQRKNLCKIQHRVGK